MTFQLNPSLVSQPDYPMEVLARLKEERLQKNLPLYDFGTGDPNISLETFLREALVAALPEVPHYPTVKGEKILIEAIQAYLEDELGVALEAEAILPTAGSKEAIYHLAPLFLYPHAPRRGVIYPDPAYPVYALGARDFGAVLYPQNLRPEHDWQMDLREVPRQQLDNSVMAWICNPHNPTGAVGDENWLKAQVAVAREHDILLCLDECYFEIHAGRRPPSVLQEKDLKGVLSFHSLSKRSGFTAYRSGFVAGDPRIIELFRKKRAHFGVASQTFIQHMAARAWQDSAHVDRRRDIFNKRRCLLIDFLEKNHFSFTGKEATFYLWVRLPEAWEDDRKYARLLFDETGIIVSPGSSFGKGGAGHIRLALVPELDETARAMEAWQKFIDKS
jgi:succinyldiaminopimelate transaminase